MVCGPHWPPCPPQQLSDRPIASTFPCACSQNTPSHLVGAALAHGLFGSVPSGLVREGPGDCCLY